MAIYHFSAKTITRSRGQSAVASAAYRAGEKMNDKRTGQSFDYRRKRNVEAGQVHLPEGAPKELGNRAALWNAAEAAENRKDSQTAREIEVSLPRELTPDQQKELANGYAKELTRDGVAVDVNFHELGKKNPHAHMMMTTRRVGPEGLKQDKARDLNSKATLERWRERWASHANHALNKHGHSARVDHRSLNDQGSDREPTKHRGPVMDAIHKRLDQVKERIDRLTGKQPDQVNSGGSLRDLVKSSPRDSFNSNGPSTNSGPRLGGK